MVRGPGVSWSGGGLIHVHLDDPPPRVARAAGVHLWDEDGKRYLDGCSGAVVSTIGHAVPEVIEAMARQAHAVEFAYRSQFSSRPAEVLAERLAASTPGDLRWVFLVSSGSEAVETALRLSVQSWREAGRASKNHFLSRQGSYHGITLGALGVSGFPARRAHFEHLLRDHPDVPPPICRTHPPGAPHEETCGSTLADDLLAAVDQQGAARLAAFVAEPIVGAAAAGLTPPPGYYERVREICDEHDIHLIVDEVMTGLGRTGRWWGIDHWPGVVPDLLVAGKGLSGGYTPLAAMCASDEVLAPIRAGSGQVMAGHTMSGNPLSAAAALAVWDYVEAHDLVANAADRGRSLRDRLEGLRDRHGQVVEVRGRGLLQGLVLDGRARAHDPASVDRLVAAAFDEGLLVYPSKGWDAAVLVAPPLTATETDLDELEHLLDRALSRVTMAVDL
jgi:adenosylmethionine-8-amino-7-oxononanoate aminotransferase